jgi:glyoxylate/hydroxypyruvate reductase
MLSRCWGSRPFTRETEGIFCARTFAMMPRGAMPVNVCRGKQVVDEDLIKALDSRQLSYAALDALWPEPCRRAVLDFK